METWHPMAVHLPIALILLWPCIDALGLVFRRGDLSALALGLLGVTVLLSMFATATGQFAYDAEKAKFGTELLDTHADYANLVPWLLLLLVGARALAPVKLGRWAHGVTIGLGFAMGAFIMVVGWTGGQLVYEHGVGVRAPVTEGAQ